MQHKKLYTLILVIFSLLMTSLTSCSIRQEIYIDADAAGNVSFDIEVEEFFKAVVEDFTVFIPEEERNVTEMNIDEIQKSINDSPYAQEADFTEIEPNHYIGTFQFGDAERFFNDVHDDLKLESLFTFTEGATTNSLRMYLDIDNYGELTELIPLLKDPSFSIFGPEENIGVSEADYLDMISYLLGEEGPGAIERSTISIFINTDSPIISHTNGIKHSPTQVEFSIPIIDFLLLAEPIDYSVTW